MRTLDLKTMTVVEALALHAQARPEQTAIATAAGGDRLTYAELWQRVCAIARLLTLRGITPGDRVMLTADSSPTFAAAYFGVHLAGAIAVPTDPAAPRPRLEDLVGRVRPSAILAGRIEPACEHLPWIMPQSELRSLGRTADPGGFPREGAFADLLFTSGTSGRAKGVLLTHANIVSAAVAINGILGIGSHDTEVVPLPLNHSFGLTRLRCIVMAGATAILCKDFRLPGEIFGAIRRHRATGFVGVPAGFAILLRFGASGLGAVANHLRYVEIGSAPMPLDHKRALIDLLPRTRLWMHYGLTEASRSAFAEFHRDQEHLDSIGRATPGVRLAIRRDDGMSLGANQIGLLWVQGPAVAAGYWDDNDLTARSFVNGWLNTGDLASQNSEGMLFLHGRMDDLVNVGGYNVSPEEVEAVLLQHSAVADAACAGIPDPRGVSGSTIAAWLVIRPGHVLPQAEELSSWMGGRLEPYKIPTRYQQIGAVPRSESGKVKRADLCAATASRGPFAQ